MKSGDVFFYFDESGVKGYTDSEPTESDFGIIGGFAFDASNFVRLQQEAEKILGSFIKICVQNGIKAHSTDAASCVVEAVRDEFFLARKSVREFFAHEQIIILYAAIHARGFFYEQQGLKDIRKKALAARTSQIEITSHDHREMLYEALFDDLLVQLEGFNRDENRRRMVIVSDVVDNGIAKKLQHRMEELSKNKLVRVVKGWNPTVKKAYKAEIAVEPVNYDLTVRSIQELVIDNNNSPLTVAADFLCNDLYRQIRSKIETDFQVGLHSDRVLEGYPLSWKVAFVGGNDFNDFRYSPEPRS